MKSVLKSMNEKEVTSNETDTSENNCPLLDRNLYKTIKKMDRASLESLINDIYESGRKKGAKEATTVPNLENSPDNSIQIRKVIQMTTLMITTLWICVCWRKRYVLSKVLVKNALRRLCS